MTFLDDAHIAATRVSAERVVLRLADLEIGETAVVEILIGVEPRTFQVTRTEDPTDGPRRCSCGTASCEAALPACLACWARVPSFEQSAYLAASSTDALMTSPDPAAALARARARFEAILRGVRA